MGTIVLMIDDERIVQEYYCVYENNQCEFVFYVFVLFVYKPFALTEWSSKPTTAKTKK